MATYKKLLKNRNGDTIIPVVDVLNYLYPVGSIYMSATMSTVAEVETAFGGTWVAWGAGRVPVGVDAFDKAFDTAEETGGAKTHRHNFKIGLTQYYGAGVGDDLANQGAYKYSTNSYPTTSSNDGRISIMRNTGITSSVTSYYEEFIRGSVGDTDLGSSLQPYITCYMYKRTA